jgi:alpha-tubulin suppressor-like RCC1 family protein
MRFVSFVAAAACAFAAASILVAQSPAVTPAPLPEGVTLDTVVVGGSHACGLTSAGKAYCWGRNNTGQLGDSTNEDRATAVLVAGGQIFRALTAGAEHTCAITKEEDDGYCWGNNTEGQLGNSTHASSNYPVRVSRGMRYASISAGGRHTCATELHWDRQQRAVCWGAGKLGQLGDQSDKGSSAPSQTFGVIRYTSLASGGDHACGSTDKGKVFCWGSNTKGQLGNASATQSQVPFPARFNRKLTIVQMVSGFNHSCALTSENEIFCWGDNGAGQIGNGKSGGRQLSPTSLKDTGFVSLAAGGDATCGLRGDHTASCWGLAGAAVAGNDGEGTRTPTPALGGVAFKSISLGAGWGCGVQQDGAAVCWGARKP